jgi:hypothetical protein
MENWIRVQFPDEQKKMDSPAATGTTPRQQGELAGKLCNA